MQSPTEARISSEPKYSRYAQLIERNLQSFDTVSEWADVISFLGKLLKVSCRKYTFRRRLDGEK
jgi:hypothetical protein